MEVLGFVMFWSLVTMLLVVIYMTTLTMIIAYNRRKPVFKGSPFSPPHPRIYTDQSRKIRTQP